MASIQTIGSGAGKKYKVTYDVNKYDGNRHRKSKTFPVGTPLSLVKEFKLKVEQELLLGELGMIENKTLNDLTDVYLANYTKFLSPTTLEGYKAMMFCKKDGKGIVQYFDGYLLKNITTQKVQEYVTFLMNCGLSPKSIRSYIMLLNTLMLTAEDLGFIRRNTNPVKRVKLPPKDHKQIEAFTAYEIRYLLDFADKTDNETAKLIITLGALCGLRRGEMAGLTWDNVQLEGFTEIHIKETIIEIDGVIYKKPPKTASGIRTIPIGANVAAILRSAKDNYEKRKAMYGDRFIDSGYVLNHEKTGINLMPEAINSRYLRFMRKQSEVPYKNLHMLRHTFASLLASNGVSPKDMQSLLGHADSYTSLQIYTHSYSDMMREDSIKLDNTVFNDSKDSKDTDNYKNEDVG